MTSAIDETDRTVDFPVDFSFSRLQIRDPDTDRTALTFKAASSIDETSFENESGNQGLMAVPYAGLPVDFYRLQIRGPDTDTDRTALAFKTMYALGDRLCLLKFIKDLAWKNYKRLERYVCTRLRRLYPLVAACIYVTCRQQRIPGITLKDVCKFAKGATETEIVKAKNFILKQLNIKLRC